MREIILNRIEQIACLEKGFPKGTMRWTNFSVNNVHISEVGWTNLTDEDLCVNFERLVRQLQKSF